MVPEYLDIPIFPLPQVTLFPHMLLTLHVFEPRYREMVQNSQRGDRLIGVTLLREGWQRDYFGRPPICKVFGVGKMIDCRLLDNGNFDIIIEGLYRVRLAQEYPTEPYRTGRARVLQDAPIDGHRLLISSMIKEMRHACDRLCLSLPQAREAIQFAWSSHPHPLVITDHLASALVVDPYDRQSILEQPDPVRRMKLMLVQVRQILGQLQGRHVQEMVEEE